MNGLTQDSLILALGSIVAVEATADTGGVIAQTSTRAVTTSLITVTLQNIRTRGALNQRAVRATSSQITHATNLLLSIPGGRVDTTGLRSQLLLGEADTSITASIGADRALAGNSLIVSVALALTGLSIASTLVRALNHGVSIVSVFHSTNPGGIFRAGSARAVGEGPSGLSVDSVVASAFIVSTARSVAIATVRAVGSHTHKNKNTDQNEKLHL